MIARAPRPVRAWCLAALLAFVAHGCASTSSGPSGDEHGRIVLKALPHGEYAQYLPRRAPKGILVIAHGSVEEEGSGESDIRKLAETFLQRWTRFADEHALIAVAPLFDHNFGSWIREPGIVPVLSAPGRYAFPDPQAPWPYGQKEVTVQGTPRLIRSDPEGWRRAAALPITVVVGSADTEPRRHGPPTSTRPAWGTRSSGWPP
jgi:hypothetical protein